LHSNTKRLAAELNKFLDEQQAPSTIRERSLILSKILDIPKQQCWTLLEGIVTPPQELLEKIQSELELELEAS
jgi:hypothetical protein